MAFNNTTSTYVFITSCVLTNFTSKIFSSSPVSSEKCVQIQTPETKIDFTLFPEFGHIARNFRTQGFIKSSLKLQGSDSFLSLLFSQLSQFHLKIITLVGIQRFVLQSHTLKQNGRSILSQFSSLLKYLATSVGHSDAPHRVPFKEGLLTQLFKGAP